MKQQQSDICWMLDSPLTDVSSSSFHPDSNPGFVDVTGYNERGYCFAALNMLFYFSNLDITHL